ncbi:MAG: 3-phenylpropionate/cinnamic acid dioxygenase subunit beta [Candidatus Tectimicrobiota bacterium]|nr:MAG: 3-phenylpropionate/cinnamic acid dioxygenase subunit beta [Candidatus Tectomicrobia bacterium]
MVASSPISRAAVEDFLYHEAALLDAWQLRQWLELLTEDVVYEIPATDCPEGTPQDTLFLIADDAARLRARVDQLLGKAAWAERPPSRTRRLLSNVRILAVEGDTLHVTANFVVYRLRLEQVDTYVGRYEYTLVRHQDTFKIRRRRVILDLEALRPHGKISILL